MTDSPKRKLAAIMFTDMVGYTALMQKDEIIDNLSPDSFGNDKVTFFLSKAQLHELMQEEKSEDAYYDSARILLEEKIKKSPKKN